MAEIIDHEKLREDEGSSMYNFSRHPQKFTCIVPIAVLRAYEKIKKYIIYTLNGKSVIPIFFMSMMNSQFSIFPGTKHYFLMTYRKKLSALM